MPLAQMTTFWDALISVSTDRLLLVAGLLFLTLSLVRRFPGGFIVSQDQRQSACWMGIACVGFGLVISVMTTLRPQQTATAPLPTPVISTVPTVTMFPTPITPSAIAGVITIITATPSIPPTPTPFIPTITSIAIVTASNTPSLPVVRVSCNWEKDWTLQPDRTYLWVGSPPGTSGCQNVGQKGDIL